MTDREFIYTMVFVGTDAKVERTGELIRCKNCKYYTGYECIRAKVSNIRVITDENEYCSRAERKEE